MSMATWLYYRIFGNPNEKGWYYGIINHVMAPLLEKEQQKIRKFFFLHYFPVYEEEECENRFDSDGPVAYVRLRVLVEKEDEESVTSELEALIENAKRKGVVLGSERCQYDLDKDLGARFGKSRTGIIVDYLYAASRLMIELVRNQKGHVEIQKVVDAIHLSANTLDFQCAGCGSIGGRIVFPCTI